MRPSIGFRRGTGERRDGIVTHWVRKAANVSGRRVPRETASAPLICRLLRGSQGRLGGGPLRPSAALPGTLDLLFLADRDTWSFSHHRFCNEAGVYWEDKQQQIYSEITLSLCTSREALLLAVDRS